MHIIEKKYGNDGYAVWFKMLEQLGHTDDHHIDISEETKQMYLSSVFNVSEELMISILDDLAKLGAIHKELWNDHRIIWSDKFIGSIEEAYKRRNNKCITLYDLCQRKKIKLQHKSDNGSSSVDRNTQSKVKKSKEDKKYQKDFLSCFDFYHENTGLPKTDKAAAYKYWVKLTDPELESIRATLDHWCKINKGEYCIKFRTYLSGKHWEDELKVKKIEPTSRPINNQPVGG